jgi:glucosamine--fructose-6-phosphate aminotransferase (isomerizing)
MCGIVGVLGDHEAAPILLDGLKRLEYRGYDSAGIATVDAGRLDRRRAMGKLVNLADLLVHEPLRGKAGIGHTRWATHGAPSTVNAHPHVAGPVAVVHNGIIENFRELRTELEAAGHVFATETDTETVAVLVAHHMAGGLDHREAAARAIARLDGAFALLMLFEGEDDLMIAARKGSPLAIGHGAGEMYVGSDALALAPMTGSITYLEEGDFAVITRAGAKIFDAAGQGVTREMQSIQVDLAAVEKGPYRHFMAKEIHEQPTVLAEAIGHYLPDGADPAALPGNGIGFGAVDRVTLVACGTAHYACMIAKYWFEQLAGLPADVDIASEYRYREPPVSPRSAAIFVSQSGETADTLAALRYSRGKAAHVLSVVNVPTSTIARESDLALPILAGAEIGVASTKAFTCQLTVLATLAIAAGCQRGHLDAARAKDICRQLRTIPGLVKDALAAEPEIAQAAARLAEAQDVLFLGRGPLYPIALEGALKFKEISYVHAEGYASGELKHGPIALIDKKMPVVVFAPRDALFDKTVSNMQEVLARQGKVLLISDAGGVAEAGADVWRSVTLPTADPVLAPLLYAIPAQLLAYHAAVTKGTDVDQPRNLAKSVTVE